MYQERYAVWAQVGQSSVMSACTRGGQPLAGQAVGRLPRGVAQEHVDLEALLEGLALEEGLLQRVAQGADGIGEDVVEHGLPTLLLRLG